MSGHATTHGKLEEVLTEQKRQSKMLETLVSRTQSLPSSSANATAAEVVYRLS